MKGMILEETVLTIELAQAKNRIKELEADKAQLQSEVDDLVKQVTELTEQRDALYRSKGFGR
jgi:peptidoglycan hydrolase CwlO-like protein